MGGRRKKPSTQPLCRSVSRYNQPRSSLSCSLHFVLFSSLLICFGFLHTVSSSSRARPPPRPSPPALRAQQERGSLEGSAVAASLPQLLAKSGQPEAASNSSQLLRIRRAKQHASCASLLGAEPGKWGRGKRFGGAGSCWAQTWGPRRPRDRPLRQAAGVSPPPPLPGAADNSREGKGCADAAGPLGKLGESRRWSRTLAGS